MTARATVLCHPFSRRSIQILQLRKHTDPHLQNFPTSVEPLPLLNREKKKKPQRHKEHSSNSKVTMSSQAVSHAEENAQTPTVEGGQLSSLPLESRKKPKNHLFDLAHLPAVDGSPNRDRRRIPSQRNQEESPTRRGSGTTSPLVSDDDQEGKQEGNDVEMRGPHSQSSNSGNPTPPARSAAALPDGIITASQLLDFEMTRDEIEEHQRGEPAQPQAANENQASDVDPPQTATTSNDEGNSVLRMSFRRLNEDEFSLEDVPTAAADVVRNLLSPVCPNVPTGDPDLAPRVERKGLHESRTSHTCDLTCRYLTCGSRYLDLRVTKPAVERRLIKAGISINSGNWERYARDLTFVTQGFTKAQLKEIFSDPDHWAWIIVFNGGVYLFSNIPEIGFSIQSLLNREFDAGITRNITPYIDLIAPREPAPSDGDSKAKGKKNPPKKGKGKEKKEPPKADQSDKYAGPIAIAVKFSDTGDMRQLFRQQTFGLNNGVGFHITPVTNTDRSHVVGYVRSNQFTCDEEVILGMANDIKLFLDNDQKFHRLVAQVVLGPEPTPDKVREITETIRLKPLPKPVVHRRIEWVALGLYIDVASRADDPFIRDRDDNRLREYIRSLGKISGTYLDTFIEPMECTLCKCDTHPTFQCSYSELETWSGPTEQVAKAVKAYHDTA
ncbi:hypothetical protein F5880DRAFT_1734217 [Lentinula raphanica]|nr:hypothetical protein F5880DRAFT_1734217 [Lentinula raphanica]